MEIRRNSLIDYFLCSVFPRRCKYCGKVIKPERTVCSDCEQLPEIKDPVCMHCGCNEKDCVCKKKSHFYEMAGAPFYYEGAIKKAVGRFKFKGIYYLSDSFAQDMAKTLENRLGEREYDYITFIPFSKKQKRRREFNCSELLARSLSEITGIECRELLKRIFDTDRQHLTGTVTRKGNVFGVYEVVDKNEVKGKKILIIDDIKTSGATVDECAKMLRFRGAQYVDCLTFAITKSKQDIDTDEEYW